MDFGNRDLQYGGVEHDTLRIFGSPKTIGYFERITIQMTEGLQIQNVYMLNSTITKAYFSTNKTCLGYSGSSVTHAFSIGGTLKLIKLDLINKVVSGKFDMKILIPDCDTLNITDGRFDIKYY